MTNQAHGAEPRSVDLIHDLIARKLIDRAVLLGEARWPGSGPLIRLAAAWPELSPEERTTRLASGAPGTAGELQSLAGLQPDLARMMIEMEQWRGAGATSEAVATGPEPAAPEEGEGLPAIESPSGTRAEAADAPRPIAAHAMHATLADVAVGERTIADNSRMIADERAIAEAAAMLERVHLRVQRSIEEATRLGMSAPAQPEPETGVVEREGVDALLADAMTRTVTTGVSRAKLPELRRTAEAFGLEYVELDADRLSRGELYGRLVRSGSTVRATAGLFPAAVVRPGMVAFIGRLLPRLSERLAGGYCDIPGTNATVRVHPGCRIIVLDRD